MSCSSLYTPPDLLAAHATWGANCGPGALAAVLGVPVMGLRPHFPKPWTTPTVMQAALTAKGRRFQLRQGFPAGDLLGLAFVQFRGTWDTAPERAQYRHAHWIGLQRTGPDLVVYDVNAGDAGGWVSSEEWKEFVLAPILAQKRGASGLWRIRVTLEVMR
ncbi:hypothetical protein D7Y15_23435 [Corallococcus sp. AB030]|uniref:hypothetical protein n=1 Tax=Corallococcus sp. AB030 TaxID=2316716 RepID=UPI000EE18B59|nr:hypothetical protein [Corallococcus sp. AB030]RKI09731.1 hypothetical protein D7Y15_23435 [Corallococcus sp. AB030]